MHEMKAKMKALECCKENMTDWFKSAMDCGKDACNVHEMGAVADMIKDLAEAEEKCWKACYYKSIVEAMEEEKEDERRGYNSNRYPSSGRYAPKGSGTRMGYMPYYPTMNEDLGRMGYPMYPPMMNDGRMGYPSNDGNSGSYGYTPKESEYGSNYDRYAEARRHYSMSHTQKDKDEMVQHANKHMNKAMESMRDIWRNAEPDMRVRMKQDLTNLINELK